MNWTRVLISLGELGLTLVMAVLVVYVTMRALIRTNTDFDEDKELLRGNLAVGFLVAALLLSSANIMSSAFAPITGAIRIYVANPATRSVPAWQMALYTVLNLALAFVIVVMTLSFSLRLFGRLVRTEKMRAGKELEKGNIAVSVLLSAVVLIVSMFVGDGVQSITKSLTPRMAVGQMRIMR